MIYGSNPNLPIKYGASYKSITNAAALTPEVIVSPAANVRGLVVWMASFSVTNGGTSSNYMQLSILAKASAPASCVDGDVIVSPDQAIASNGWIGKLMRPVFIPAGKGLYYISTNADTGCFKSVLYDLL